MKFILTLFAALVVLKVSAVPLESSKSDIIKTLIEVFEENDDELNYLDRDLLDFVKLIPIEKIIVILQKYENDPEILSSYDYARTVEFHDLVYAVEALSEHRRYVRVLQEAGYNKIRELKLIHEFLGMEVFVSKKRRSLAQELKTDNTSEGGLNGLIKDFIAILPVKEIKELHEKKLIESQPFAKFNLYVSSSRFGRIVTNLTGAEEYKQMVQEALKHGIDIALMKELFSRIIGYKP